MQWNRNFFTSGVLFSATCFSMSRAVFACYVIRYGEKRDWYGWEYVLSS